MDNLVKFTLVWPLRLPIDWNGEGIGPKQLHSGYLPLQMPFTYLASK